MKVDPIPPDKELEKRRETKFVIDPKQVSKKDEERVSNWSRGIMKKNEHKLDFHNFKHLEIVTSDVVEAEDIDIANIYPFPDLNWLIYRHHQSWNLMLRARGVVLFIAGYAKI